MMQYFSSHLTLALDADRCVGCGLCAKVCPHGVFRIEGKRAAMADRDACIECGACARNCPVEAITVASGVGCAEAIINGLLTGKEACCGEGECCGAGGKNDGDAGNAMEANQMNEQTDSQKTDAKACGPGCSCNSAGQANRTRWVLGGLVLLAAAFLVARGIVKNGRSLSQKAAPGFAVVPTTGGTSAWITKSAAAPAGPAVGTELAALADLNVVATNADAVFVYVPGKGGTTNHAPVAQIAGAAKTLAARGIKTSVFTLRTDSPDHAQIASEMAAPGVVAMVKGRGAVPVSGDITEEKLVQAFVAASSVGCGGTGCCGSSGCK